MRVEFDEGKNGIEREELLRNLIREMLMKNPKQRISMTEVLKHKYFE